MEVCTSQIGDVLAMSAVPYLPQSVLRPLFADGTCRCDFLGAIVFRTPLAYVPTDAHPKKESSQYPFCISQTSPLLSADAVYKPSTNSSLSRNSFVLLSEMHELTRLFDNHRSEASLYDLGFRSFERSLYPDHQAMTSDSIDDKMHQCLWLAGRIYTRTLTNDIPFGHPSNLATLGLLRKSLKPTLLGGWRDLPGALLWVLLVGTAAERDCREGNFLAGCLSSTCLYIGFRHWDAVRDILERFMAIEDKVDERANRAPREC